MANAKRNVIPGWLQIDRAKNACIYFIKTLRGQLNFLKPANTREIVHEIRRYIPRELSKGELLIRFIDLVYSRFRYKATLEDYLIFEFWKKSAYGREKVITEGQGLAIWQAFNPPEFDHLFSEKNETYQIFKQFYGREIVSYNGIEATPEVYNFFSRNIRFFIKPHNGCAGIGAKIIDQKQYENGKESILQELQGAAWVFEELIEQEGSIAQIYPYSINTIRINTVVTRGAVKILSAAFRMGNNGGITDNFHQGGIAAPVDISSGIIYGLATDRWNRTYTHHPFSGVKLIGLSLPQWNKVLELAHELVAVVPQVRFVGWDIALTSKGIPVMVEGNVHPGFQVQSVVLENMKEMYLSLLKE